MSGQCSQCGALLQAGTRFCGTCGAAAGGQAKTGGSATTAWVVAVVAIGLLGAALAYIVVSRDEAEPVAADAAAPVAGTAEPAPAQPAKPLPMADTATPPAAFVPSPAPVRAVPARVGNGSSDAGLIGSYRAWIGNADLYASDGARLTRPWQILRQDRANVHRFGIVDPGDQNDAFFASANARAIMERMVMNGSINPSAARRMAGGGVMVTVSIYGRGSRGDYVDVIVE